MSLTIRGPTPQQQEAWVNTLRELQRHIHLSDTMPLQVYIKSLLMIVEDLIESFREPTVICRKCGSVLRHPAWDGLCQTCFDIIVGRREENEDDHRGTACPAEGTQPIM